MALAVLSLDVEAAPMNRPFILDDPSVDIDRLRAKYRFERDRRLHANGEDQYIGGNGDFARFFRAGKGSKVLTERQPVVKDVAVAIVGGGFGGLLAAVRLQEAGITDVQIVDRASDFGGTWFWNQYPGAQCDVESYIYLPLLEETGYIPKEKYSYAPEIFEHAQRIGRQFDLYKHAMFETGVNEMRWDPSIKRWRISTDRDDEFRARFVIAAPGPVNIGKLPGIPGLRDFEGHTFHTSRWDYEYTGGDNTGNLFRLSDKRVGIIGTGATAVQCVPALAASSRQLFVFQRTPSTIGVRGNKPTDPEWARSLAPGWQRERQDNMDEICQGRPVAVDMINDGLTDIFRKLRPNPNIVMTQAEKEKFVELADFRKMNEVRARVDSIVGDRETAELLKPWYGILCKRPCFNDEYLDAFNRPNVRLIDTSGSKGVERLTKRGVVAGDVEYEIDCLILSTGFEQGSSWKRKLGLAVYGIDGLSLADHWANGQRTLHGYATHRFPNWFYVGPGQVGGNFNYTAMAQPLTQQIAYVVNEAMRRGIECVQPSAKAEEEWLGIVRPTAEAGLKYFEECTPGYYNNEGNVRGRPPRQERYAPGAKAFENVLLQWREAGAFPGFEVS